MTGVLGFVAYLLLPLIGIGVWRVEAVRKLPLVARLAVAFASGILITSVVMALMSLVGLEWNRTRLFVILGLIAAAGWRFAHRGTHDPERATEDAQRRLPRIWWPILIFVLLTAYGLMTARESAGDLHFFWGPKAVRFFRAGGIDAAYLRTPDYQPAHPDYPPLIPLMYAWSHTLSSATFSFAAAVAATLLFLFGAVAIVYGASGDGPGALLIAAVLSYTFAVGFAAGGADPPLIFFETIALVAVTFLRNERGSDILATIGLAGAAWTKIEGATFGIALVLALLLVRRDWKRAVRISILPIVLLGSWVAFTRIADLLELYRGAAMDLYWPALPATLRTMAGTTTYELWGLPWIAPLALVMLARNRREATLPLLVALLTTGVSIFFYIHLPDPTWWILASAHRVLLTPLLALLIAAVAAWRPRTI